MNYYKRHIGDYAKKAGHLSVLEHGVYTLLLDAYYDRELAPTRAEALRQARARTPEEVAAVDAVLADFFTLDGDRYTQSRVEEEFVKAEEQAKKNEENGRRGGRPRKPKGNPKETQPVSEVNPSESEKNPNPLIHQSTKKKDQKTDAPAALPDWLSPDDWALWVKHRGGKKFSADAQAFSLRSLAKLRSEGNDPRAVIEQAIERGWTGLFEVRAALPRAGPASAQPSKTLAAIQRLEAMKHGLADTRNIHGDSKAVVPQLGSDSGNGLD